MRQRVRELEERERKESKKLADEDALRKIRVAEETIEHLQKKLAATKQVCSVKGLSAIFVEMHMSFVGLKHDVLFQEEEALLSEMDVTGQAFEDMQEQNSRLMQQLREKDDANFKLMSERIKSNQIYKLLREEKEELADQVLTFKTQVRFSCLTQTGIKAKLKLYEASKSDLQVLFSQY